MPTLYLDTETYNDVDLKEAGTYRYAETAEIMLITYALDDQPVQCWDYSEGHPAPDLAAYVAQYPQITVKAHNAMFDRTVLRLGDLRQGIPVERWECTMVQAMQHALPASLDELGRVLGLPQDQAKLADGKKLINRFCKPAPRNHKADRYDRHTHPELWQRFREYAIRDVEALREIDRRLPTWNWSTLDVAMWRLDQRINDRGFCVDTELARAGARATVEEKADLRYQFMLLTGGLEPSQRAKVQAFINAAWGLRLDSTAKHAIQPLIDDPATSDHLRRICEIILAANKSSTAKYVSIGNATSSDGRFRGGLQFSGAGRTRRWAGRTFQPQNLPSRGLPKPERIEAYIDALKAGTHRQQFDDLMLYGAASLRGVVIAPDGHKLVVSDLSNIEGRGVPWLAGEQWKLDAFRAFDAGTGPDLYHVTATGIIGGDPWHVAKADRNVFGKVPELALGYEGGAGALQTFAKAYGVNMADHWDTIQQNVDPMHVAKARENLETWGRAKQQELEITETEWLASETVKLAWRHRHPAIRKLWYACKDAAIAAIQQPGRTFMAGQWLTFGVVVHGGHKWLLVELPSGRYLTYFDPRVHDGGGISYMGMGNEAGDTTGPRIWCRLFTYGGKLVENITQALAGDILKENMPAMEAVGYRVVLTVHDEAVTEVPDTPAHNVADLSRILSTVPSWAPGLPLAADGFEAYRYKKD